MGEIEQWFSYSEDDGFRRHASADEARACAARALDDDTDASGDGWPEDTHSICWGEVREAAVETVTHKHGPDCRPADEDDDDVHDCTDDFDLRFDYISRFDLTPTTQASDIAEATARAEVAEQRAAAAEAERDAADLGLRSADALLSEGLGIVLSLSDGYDVWIEQVRDHLSPDPHPVEDALRAERDAAVARAEAAEAKLAAILAEEAGLSLELYQITALKENTAAMVMGAVERAEMYQRAAGAEGRREVSDDRQ